eukprot:TRINITY_DN5469_c0_g1_i1.p1 TRINITY_DN5469_c0_g1~~TRINITY_DN5469_c0_g1_i1.p1  ORF type:complete len:293 (-),score=65.04 TRINITY_DN5469_c0_g1_i1:18-896(-)
MTIDDTLPLNLDFDDYSSDDDCDGPQCRICLSILTPTEFESMDAVAPCLCKGSMQFTHSDCQLEWLRATKTVPQAAACSLCGAKLNLRVVRPPLLESVATVVSRSDPIDYARRCFKHLVVDGVVHKSLFTCPHEACSLGRTGLVCGTIGLAGAALAECTGVGTMWTSDSSALIVTSLAFVAGIRELIALHMPRTTQLWRRVAFVAATSVTLALAAGALFAGARYALPSCSVATQLAVAQGSVCVGTEAAHLARGLMFDTCAYSRIGERLRLLPASVASNCGAQQQQQQTPCK